tara:strand:+ start:354 stop:779 length:426 start_codon:yes stop_codon:yes gene_type:complete
MEDSISRPNGPQTYAALFEQAPDVVMGNPLIYGILVDALHQGVERFYAGREEAFRQAKDAEAEGKIHFIQPELMKQTIEDCYSLLNIASKVADGKYPASKCHVVEDEHGDETVNIPFRTLLKEYMTDFGSDANGKIQIEQH